MAAVTHAARPLVVVVDDAHALRLVMARTLTEAGYDVLTAPDGLSATTLIQCLRASPDLVVTDLKMPAMDGGALAEWLAHHFPRVPVIFVSGFPGDHAELPDRCCRSRSPPTRSPRWCGTRWAAGWCSETPSTAAP